jgi:fructokinase
VSALERWLATEAGVRVARSQPLAGGYRNLNTLLVTDAGQRYVLRRYRHGNPCAVEAALAARLAGVVPVAEVVAADASGSAAGEPVLLSRFVPGRLMSTLLPGLSGDAGQLGRAVGAVLAAVGTVSFPGPGLLTGAGLEPVSPDGFDLPGFVAGCLARRHPDHDLGDDGVDRLRRHAARVAVHVDEVRGASRLVHSDFNPKNLLVTLDRSGWTVTAVLDWEFAFSGSPLADVGNMLRFAGDYPPAYVDGFVAGFRGAGGHLPPDWREISRALDLYALVDFLTRPANDISRRAVALLRRLR